MNVLSGEIGTNMVLGDAHREIPDSNTITLKNGQCAKTKFRFRLSISTHCVHIQSTRSKQNEQADLGRI